MYKRYLKTEYRQHCRAESSPCADHCRPFALSDPINECFAATDCLHEHNQSCDSCEQFNEVVEAIENKMFDLSSHMYSKEQQEEMKYDFKQAKDHVYNWKAHIMRAENQEEGKQDVLRKLDAHSALLLLDWAMKFNKIRYREKQSEWFAKRGINWHVSSVVRKGKDGSFQVSYFAHLFDGSCTQDWYAVASLLESLIQAIREQVDPLLQKIFLRSDEAGCYHNVNLYAAAKDLGKSMGVRVEGYDHSEPQFGKEITDRIICPLKGSLRRFCNEGNNVLCADDMYKALKSRPVRGTTAAVCKLNEESQNLSLRKVKGFSEYHNFRNEDKGLRVWKAFDVGKGKLIEWDDIFLQHQGPTNIEISKENGFFPVTSRDIEFQPRCDLDKSDDQSDKLFKCQEQDCTASFQSIEEVEAHHSFFDHKKMKDDTEGLFDTLRRKWVGQFSSVAYLSQGKAEMKSIAGKAKCSTTDKGWALQKPRAKGSRFNEKVRKYLIAKYDIGETTKHKCDPLQVSKDMRKALAENGDRLFVQSEWLTKTQIQGFFSRLTASRRKMQSKVNDQEVPEPEMTEDFDEDEDDDDEEEDQADMLHNEVLQNVITEVALTHPIMYDIYDLCTYVREDKLVKFTVPVLKDICGLLDISFKSKDRKDVLVTTITDVVHECSCFN